MKGIKRKVKKEYFHNYNGDSGIKAIFTHAEK